MHSRSSLACRPGRRQSAAHNSGTTGADNAPPSAIDVSNSHRCTPDHRSRADPDVTSLLPTTAARLEHTMNETSRQLKLATSANFKLNEVKLFSLVQLELLYKPEYNGTTVVCHWQLEVAT